MVALVRFLSCCLVGATFGCGSGTSTIDAAGAQDGRTIDDAGGANADSSLSTTDFSQPGPASVADTTGTFSVNGCALDYTLYTPAGGETAPLVVLGHGFSRTADNVTGIAEHIASHGLRVVTPNFCHSSALDTDHEQNGIDAAALSAELRAGADVIHAGHSAGGLAAVIAAANDSATIAVLGLDMVDSDSLGAGAVGSIAVPGLGLFGDPSSCNSSGNGRAVFAALSSVTSIHVAGATHCDFEAPTSGLCTSFCGGNDEARLATVRALAAAFAAWRGGVDPTGAAWVTAGGSELTRLVDDGLVDILP